MPDLAYRLIGPMVMHRCHPLTQSAEHPASSSMSFVKFFRLPFSSHIPHFAAKLKNKFPSVERKLT